MTEPPAPLGAWMRAALEAVDPARAVQRHTNRALAPLLGSGRLHIVGAGKAVLGMLEGVAMALPGLELRGVCIEKPGASPRRFEAPTGVVVLPGDHPIPGPRSFDSTARLVEAIGAWPADAPVVALISGGASSLLCHPAPTDRADFVELNRAGLGLDIARLNEARARLDPLKAGGLARLIGPRPFRVLVLDDVPTARDALATVGSAPTLLEDNRSAHTIVASNATATQAVCHAARQWGADVLVDRIDGVAHEEGERLAATLLEAAARKPNGPVVLVAGGESRVDVRGPGLGGRNQELALGAARRLSGHPATLLALATDGEDGPTDTAGAWVDSTTAVRAGSRLDRALERNDAYPLLDELGCLLRTGRTGTNVADVVIGLAMPHAPAQP